MPEMELPGIDPAPTAPAAPSAPAEPASPVTAEPTLPEAALPSDPNAAPEGDDEPRGKKTNRVQLRINELTQDKHELQRALNETQGLVRELVTAVRSGNMTGAQAQAQVGIAGSEAPPNEKDFSNWQDFLVAQASYKARQDLRAELRQAQQQHQQTQRQMTERQQAQQRSVAVEQLHGGLGEQMKDAIARYPDYAEVVGAAVDELPLNVEAAMVVSGAGGDVAYYLAQHPEVVNRLAQLPDMMLGHQIARIAHAMRNGSASSSAAPAPGRPVGARGSAPLDYPANATPEQHLAYRQRVFGAKQKRA